MSDLLRLTEEQMERLGPFVPKGHGKSRVDDRRVLSGIVFVNPNGLRWRDAPSGHCQSKGAGYGDRATIACELVRLVLNTLSFGLRRGGQAENDFAVSTL